MYYKKLFTNIRGFYKLLLCVFDVFINNMSLFFIFSCVQFIGHDFNVNFMFNIACIMDQFIEK
jgi:hypothetical protein